MRFSFCSLLTLFLILMSSASSAQFIIYKPDLTVGDFKLKGKVQSLEVTNYDIHDLWDQKNVRDTTARSGTHYNFDMAGNCTESIYYLFRNGEKEVSSKSETSFDEHGNVVEHKSYNGDTLISVRIVSYTYDAQGRITETYTNHENSKRQVTSAMKRVYTYNADRSVQVETINLLETNTTPVVEIYDARGVNVETGYAWGWSADSWQKSIYRQKKNEQGQIIEELQTDNGDKVSRVIEYTYDDRGNIIERKQSEPENGLTYRTQYTYDNRNNCIIETRYNQKGDLINHYKQEYDLNNNRVKIFFMKNLKKIDFEITYTYTYDLHQNWIVEIEASTSEYLSEGKTERTITYYE